MPTHAILVTWRNMEPKVLPAFISKAQGKYGGNFSRLYFDNGSVKDDLLRAVGIAATNRIKVYISGHGGTGIEYITDDTETQKQTVADLIDLLSHALNGRATTKAACDETQVNMISCLFGRTPDGLATSSPAAKLHQGLIVKNVFVDLVARTESVVCQPGGRQTISAIDHYVYEPAFGRLPKFFKPKVPYTKVLHTFHGGATVIRLDSYDSNELYVETSSKDGERLLWADYVVNELVKRIHLTGTGILKRGEKAVTDSRQQALRDLIVWYDNFHNPTALKAKMEGLVDGMGEDEKTNFLIHRNPLSKAFSSEEPKTAQLIRDLLGLYPV